MKDFPVFPTEYGVASLTLREIPYRKIAYIHVQDVQPGGMRELLTECFGFCRACGAETVLAGGTGDFTEYDHHGSVLEMRLTRSGAEELPPASLWPVTAETVSKFRTIYNERMAQVDYAATLSSAREKEILSAPGAYFVHRDGVLLGIGWLQDDELKAIAALKPGTGQVVAETLLSAASGDRIRLEVASGNTRAIRLYEKMGFLKTRELMRWYVVKPESCTKSEK